MISRSRPRPPWRPAHPAAPAAEVIHVAVDRDAPRHQRMRPDPSHILYHARVQVGKAVPLDIAALVRAWAATMVVPALSVDAGRLKAIFQQTGDHLVVGQ